MTEDQKTVPDIYRMQSGRMMWEYIFTNDGGIQDHINGSYNFEEVLLEVLPFIIIPNPEILDQFEEEHLNDAFDEWMTKNMRGCWQMWAVKGELRQPAFYFERDSDAVLFKLRWS